MSSTASILLFPPDKQPSYIVVQVDGEPVLKEQGCVIVQTSEGMQCTLLLEVSRLVTDLDNDVAWLLVRRGESRTEAVLHTLKIYTTALRMSSPPAMRPSNAKGQATFTGHPCQVFGWPFQAPGGFACRGQKQLGVFPL